MFNNLNKKIFLLFLFLVILSMSVYSTGNCALDKFKYNPGGLGAFGCGCDSAAEENKAGNVVWRNSSGIILQNTSVNSGSCMTSLFGDTYLFLDNANYTGNVTFESESVVWNNADDVINDSFNVTGADAIDCLISDITSFRNFTIGQLVAGKFKVLDGVSGNPLLHASCIVEFTDIDGNLLITEPYGAGDNSRFTQSGGHIGFQLMLDNDFWVVSTTYGVDIYCHCIPNSTHGDACIDDSTGGFVGYKSCDASSFFNTGSEDLRVNERLSMISVVLALILVIAFFALIGFAAYKTSNLNADKGSFWIAFLSFAMVIVELGMLLGVLYINNSAGDITTLLQINFYIVSLIGFGIGIAALINSFFELLRSKELEAGKKQESNGKWENDRKW